MPTDYDVNPGICNDYAYNGNNMPHPSLSGKLQKAWLFSVKKIDSTTGADQPTQYSWDPAAKNAVAMVDSVFAKKFQFNPPSLSMQLQTIDAVPPGTLAEGGNDLSKSPGLASMSFEMLFDRTIEVGLDSQSSGGQRFLFGVPWKDLGVAKDVMDVFSVMLGTVSMADYMKGNFSTTSTVFRTDGSVNSVDTKGNSIAQWTSTLFGLAGTGASQIYMQRVALAYNNNLVVYGQVTEFSHMFTKFNSNLVPTMATVRISLQIFDVNTNTVPTNVAMAGGGTVPLTSGGPGNTGQTTTTWTGTKTGRTSVGGGGQFVQ